MKLRNAWVPGRGVGIGPIAVGVIREPALSPRLDGAWLGTDTDALLYGCVRLRFGRSATRLSNVYQRQWALVVGLRRHKCLTRSARRWDRHQRLVERCARAQMQRGSMRVAD